MKFSWEYFLGTFPLIAEKLPVTLSLTLISAGFSLALGTVMALVNYYRVPVLTQFLKAWSSFIRGTPEEIIDNPENPRIRQFLNFVSK